MSMRILVTLLLFYAVQPAPWWTVQASGRNTNLRGVCVKSMQNASGRHYVIWASGSNGVVLRSVDDGNTWKQLAVEGSADLDFRDIEAFDDNVAYLMSSGDGAKSRIYKTIDGGMSWKLQYTDQRAGFFLDSMACSSRTHFVAVSDPVEGKFLVIVTNDGEHWKDLARNKMPAALPQEGVFAASGSEIAFCGSDIFFGTGGPAARVFRSKDDGLSWTVVETPLPSGNASSGIFGLACDGRGHMVAVGGDYKNPTRAGHNAAYSDDSGMTWKLSQNEPGGFRSAVGLFSHNNVTAVGPNGIDVSEDNGAHWVHTDALNLNALKMVGDDGWAVGANGTIARFHNQDR
jgi:photosystem II stability/assembly factor-like uncharacterized protein